MRLLYLAVIVIFVAAAIIFAFQNLESVTVSFLGFDLTTRLAVLVFIIYALGAVTGGSLFGLLRRSYQQSRLHSSSPHHTGAE